MARNKKHLEGLLEIIKQISVEDGNNWFLKNLSESLGINAPNFQPTEDYKINDIHEHFFKKIIEKQAEDFYKAITYNDQKKQLIEDFIKMEYSRRANDFESFCLAMYQQVELIINFVYENESMYKKVVDEQNTVIRANDSYMVCNFIAKSKKLEHIQKLYSADPKNWSFNQKFRAVVLLKYLGKEKLFFNLNLIERICTIGNYLHLGRNEVHRGAMIYEYQKNKIEEIRNNPQEFYLRFLGFLEEFISLVCKHNSLLI